MKMYQMLDLGNLYATIGSMKMPLKTAYKFNKLSSIVEKELQFYQDRFSEILTEFGQKDEEGNYIYTEDKTSVSILPGREAECAERVNELRMLDVETPNIEFDLEELEDLSLTISELAPLMELIRE